jgi:hypothetical protein
MPQAQVILYIPCGTGGRSEQQTDVGWEKVRGPFLTDSTLNACVRLNFETFPLLLSFPLQRLLNCFIETGL